MSGSIDSAANVVRLGVILVEGVVMTGVFGVILARTELEIKSLALRLLELGVPFLMGDGV